MQLKQATDADNEQLLQYFSKAVLPGSAHIRVRRMHSFFNQYRLQSDDFVTYLLKNKKGNIEASASLVFRKAYIDGKEQTIGYATDLRVSPTRRAIVEWSTEFLPVLEQERQARGCQYIFSTVSMAQRQAYNAFIRPRSLRRNFPRYHLFRKFSLIGMHGLWPFHSRPLPGIEIVTATISDQNDLANYIVETCKDKNFHFYGKSEDFHEALKKWNGLHMEDFLLAKNHDGKIIGCTARWSSHDVQQYFVTKYNHIAENMRDILNIFALVGKAHPLPKPGQELHLCHLPFLQADNPDIVRSLLYAAYLKGHKRELLVYPHFEDDLLMSPPRRFITTKRDFGLYCVLSPTDSIPEFLKPQFPNPAPTFEPALM